MRNVQMNTSVKYFQTLSLIPRIRQQLHSSITTFLTQVVDSPEVGLVDFPVSGLVRDD